jgi:hypothetical protein
MPSRFYNLTRPAVAEWLWNRYEGAWEHRDLPVGQRFLGSVTLSQAASEEVLDIARDNLNRLDTLTWLKLQEHFGPYETDWIKFLTFALSEYAYYDKEEAGYWRGLCHRLSIRNNLGTQNALRALIKRGIDELGLVQKPGRHVSTLWLQSGIPQRGLKHFARLIQSLDYGWWEMAQADPVDLAILLRDTCEQRFPHFRTLMNFLKSSCSEEDDVSPISGTLLQGLARVAHELEMRGQSPEILTDATQRATLLHEFALPNAFFLRSWDSLIEILQPRHPGVRPVISFRQKPMVLRLDVEDSFEIQLVLPAQHLYRREWGIYTSTFCTIPEAPWEGNLELTGTGAALEIHEDVCRTVSQPAEEWVWHLKSHTGQSLLTWACPGLRDDQWCLMFDANTGERRTPGQLGLSSELILFFPEETECQYSPGIEIIDSWLPCSWFGWQGHLIHRQGTDATITLRRGEFCQMIAWDVITQASPELQGARLPGRQQKFIGVPTFWIPPSTQGQDFNIVVEDLTRKMTLTAANETLEIDASSDWSAVDLQRWITKSGDYSIQVWNDNSRWRTKFAVQETFILNKAMEVIEPQICNQNHELTSIPIIFKQKDDFELARITIKNCWPLETIQFQLQSAEKETSFFESASATGEVYIDMTSQYGVLSGAEGYRLRCCWAGDNKTLLTFNFNQEDEVVDPLDLDEKEDPLDPIPTRTKYWMRSSTHRPAVFLRFIRATLRQKAIEKYFKSSVEQDHVCLEPIDDKFNYQECINSLCTNLKKRFGGNVYWGVG